MQMEGVPVTVTERCLPNGVVTPLTLTWDLTVYKIDRIVEKKKEVIHKTGEVIMCYLVEICGQQRYMYRTATNRWRLIPLGKSKPLVVRGLHCCPDVREMED